MTTPAMDTALAASVVPDFVALEIVFPFYTLRLIDGASRVAFPVKNLTTGTTLMTAFVGEDPTYGTMTGLESASEGLGTSAPKMRFVIRCDTNEAAAQLNLPGNQGSPVRMWYGVVNYTTGAVIDAPEEMFWGEIDQPRFVGGRGGRSIEFDTSSAMELLFASDEGQRLNHAFLQTYAPGDMGLEYVVDVERQLPWGSEAGRPPLVSAAGGGYVGGGGGAGGGPVGGGGGGGGRWPTWTRLGLL